MTKLELHTIVSGGQTGADRAALDFAREAGFDYGGFVPKGRSDEFGAIPTRYAQLEEAPSEEPAVRTTMNVFSADGTVIFSHGALMGGSLLTAQVATALERPLLHLDLASISRTDASVMLAHWLHTHRIRVLNVAGPRHSEDVTIYSETLEILRVVLGVR